MAERTHEPKLAALAALHEGRLSPRGRARLQRHLARCATCRSAQSGLAHYGTLRAQLESAAVPVLDVARIEQAVLRQAARAEQLRRARRAFGAVGLVAAAAAVVAVLVRPAPPPPPVRDAEALAKPVPKVPEPRRLAVHVAAIAGSARLAAPGGEAVPLTLDALPVEAATLETDPDSEVHLWLEDTAELRIGPSSRIALTRLREPQVELDLARGEVTSSVRPLGERGYAIAAQGHRVVVRGTLFSVAHEGDAIAVQLDHGSVAVLRDDAVVAELRAPQRWAQPAEAAPAEGAALREPHRAAPGSQTWPVLEVPAWPRVVTWDIGGTQLPAAQALRMRVPTGLLQIDALLVDGRRMHAQIVVGALGARFDPRELRFDRDGAAAETPSRAPDPAAAAAVIRAGHAGLQRCYERSLRNQPAGALRARLQLQLDARGAVRHARLRSDQPIPALLGECVRNLAATWRFPAPGGGGITFEAPLSFQPR
jgi:hypothetical protein